jgi:vacuolar-type H+-ATPase subunit H
MSEAADALVRIRHTELAAARQVEAAREEAERILAGARVEARTIRARAEEEGRRRAQHHLELTVSGAEREAERLRRVGEEEARQVLDEGAGHIELISEAMLSAVLAPPREGGR